MEKLVVKVKGGFLVAIKSIEPEYPGIDIEFVKDNFKYEGQSRPRILFEKPEDGELRALIWDDENSEDYTKEIEFKE